MRVTALLMVNLFNSKDYIGNENPTHEFVLGFFVLALIAYSAPKSLFMLTMYDFCTMLFALYRFAVIISPVKK